MNPSLLCDFYKVGHIDQYPKGITRIWTNWTPRTSRVADQGEVVHFGLQYFIKEYLKSKFDNDFFWRSWESVRDEYIAVIAATLGVGSPRIDHWGALYNLGYLPIDIYSIPEGDSVPLGVPAMVIVNTKPEFFWLPNFLETMLSMTMWKPTTSATTAQRFRKIGVKWAREFGYGDTELGFVDWQFHDFSMRGMSGLEDAYLSGMGHLLSFSGTDSIPAILAANKYYNAALTVGGSVPATEHSVMCAGLQDGELETFRRLLAEVYPSGVVSVVSDTWDLWKVLGEFVPVLRDLILSRDGKLVIRPDSGDPVKIMCGDPDSMDPRIKAGVLTMLASELGTDAGMIRKAGAIYGDSINEERADAILGGLVRSGLSPYNAVLGVGSFTYEFKTRDTYGFAMKATAFERGGTVTPIFKDPVTDNGGKRSHKGIPVVYGESGTYFYKESVTPSDLDSCSFRKVFSDGKIVIEDSFDVIRGRARAWQK